MSSSRRSFLKSTAIATAGVALDAVPGLSAQADAAKGMVTHGASEPQVAPGKGEFTRGVGVYPGDPREDFSPELVIDSINYRNLALLRPAYHSSSYDFNLTAQLVTDGIKDTRLPTWVGVSIGDLGSQAKARRELALNHSRMSAVALFGSNPSLQFEIGGGAPPEVDRVDVVVIPPTLDPANLSFTVSVSDDGRTWEKVGTASAPKPAPVEGYPPDFVRAGHLFVPSIALNRACRSRFFQVEFTLANPPERSSYMQWQVGEVEFYRNNERMQVGGPYSFTSAWMSAGPGEEWVYVDLGAHCTFDRVKLYWIHRTAEGAIQVSDDAQHWHDIHKFHQESGQFDDVKLAVPTHGRYVRVLMTRPTSPEGYILSEIEIFGRGGPVPRHKSSRSDQLSKESSGRFNLAGTPWRLQRQSLTKGDGAEFSKIGFDARDWMVATVPGTALVSYLNAGAIPDPNYGTNQLYISDSYFYSDFWYRTGFTAPAIESGRRVWLNFDGINWKADVFLNGDKLGRIEGAFMRGRFDVTEKIRSGEKNALAVCIEKNATPGSCKQKLWEDGGPNGGAPGSDSPTYHASVGWDWIPTIRGRNTGIIGDVYLTTSGAVTIANPFVNTSLPLPDFSRADVTIDLDLINHSAASVSGTLRGRLGDSKFEQRITLDAATNAPSIKHVRLEPSSQPALRVQNPKLWWPVGYGEPSLHEVELTFEVEGGQVSDSTKFLAGLRQITHSEDGGALKLWVNGRRFIPKGGNWGFSESMLRYRKREYDAALRYHREMNFNMIRNWIGQIGDDAFYDACDRHGVMVWQDFWLANPWDGPEPDDNALFMSNAKDTVLRVRNHASMGIYCGRNEGDPPKPLDDGLRTLLADLHPGLHYISNSAERVVGGGGPYSLQPLAYYPKSAAFDKLHSEIGIPTIPSVDSLRLTLSPKGIWPPGQEWGLHDLPEHSFRGPTFFESLANAYGPSDNFEEWVSLAQLLVYEGFRAEFEAQSKYRMGLLLWMSHCCWPSLTWQTYDYFMEPTAGYFACKKACEPLHIQWNRLTDEVHVVNYSAGNVQGLTARAELLTMDGTVKWSKTASLDSAEDTAVNSMQMEYPTGLSAVHFIRLTLLKGQETVSANLYMRGLQEGDCRAIRQLAKAQVKATTQVARQGDLWELTTELQNTSPYPALGVRLKVVREKTGDRILPVIFDDNYATLMPGERRTFRAEVHQADTRGEVPRMVVEGFNVKAI